MAMGFLMGDRVARHIGGLVKTKYVLATLAVVALLLGGFACVPLATTPQTSAAPVSTTLSSTSAQTSPPSPVESSTLSLMPDFVSVVAKVRPSVVAIATEATGSGFFGGSYTEQGAGSGWIIDQNGLIVTNNHVVEGANSVSVTLEDGRTFAAKSVYTDAVSDLAIVKIDAQSLPALRIGDSSKMQVGQWVVAIGNSLGMGISATKGMVSALGVSLSPSPGESLDGLIQTDAAINPGNSGGPLVNLIGEIIGINSAKIAQVGVEGMGYAISIKTAKPIIDELITNGYVVRPYLGASLYTVDQFVALRYRLAVDSGVLVTDVASGSPADEAGLKPGDVITSVDDKQTTDDAVLTQSINSDQVGQKIKISYWRGRTQNTTYATLVQSPPPAQ